MAPQGTPSCWRGRGTCSPSRPQGTVSWESLSGFLPGCQSQSQDKGTICSSRITQFSSPQTQVPDLVLLEHHLSEVPKGFHALSEVSPFLCSQYVASRSGHLLFCYQSLLSGMGVGVWMLVLAFPLPVWLLVSHASSLNFRFFICKMGLVKSFMVVCVCVLSH